MTQAQWKKKLNGLRIQDKAMKHACFMALYMVVDLNTSLAKAKHSAANRHGVSMAKIDSVVKDVLGQDFFNERSRFKRS